MKAQPRRRWAPSRRGAPYAWNRAERCRDLAEECRRVAALCSSTQMRNHHLQMEEHYNTLARAEELAAPWRTRSATRRTCDFGKPDGRCVAHAACRQVKDPKAKSPSLGNGPGVYYRFPCAANLDRQRAGFLQNVFCKTCGAVPHFVSRWSHLLTYLCNGE